MISAVEAILAVQEKTWIPTDLDTPKTFFSENDWWQYGKSYGANMCHQCDFFGDVHFFSGTDIRLSFPYLEIVDEDTIYPWVHPNCNCILTRVLSSVK